MEKDQKMLRLDLLCRKGAGGGTICMKCRSAVSFSKALIYFCYLYIFSPQNKICGIKSAVIGTYSPQLVPFALVQFFKEEKLFRCCLSPLLRI